MPGSSLLVRGDAAPALDARALGYDEVADWSGQVEQVSVTEIRRRLAEVTWVLVAGDVRSLHLVVEGLHRLRRTDEVVVGFVPSVHPSDRRFVERFGLPSRPLRPGEGSVRPVRLARDDIGGVLVDSATFRDDGRRAFGAQAYHDDQLIADGPVLRIEVETDADDTAPGLIASVRRSGLRRPTRTVGRAVQIACTAAFLSADNIASADVAKRTYYVDDRAHWNLAVG